MSEAIAVADPLLSLRPAAMEDALVLWSWRNDPVTRQWSFNKAEVPWDEHRQWVAARLADQNCLIYIAEGENHEALGQTRFSLSGEQAEIHITVAPEHRGRGIGSALIAASCERLFSERPEVDRILARAFAENTASVKAFEKAGFSPVPQGSAADTEIVCLALHRYAGTSGRATR